MTIHQSNHAQCDHGYNQPCNQHRSCASCIAYARRSPTYLARPFTLSVVQILAQERWVCLFVWSGSLFCMYTSR